MNRAAQNILFFCLLSFVLCLSACRPKGILHSWEMRDVLVDLHKTDAMLQATGLKKGSNEICDLYYAQALAKHGVTQAEFDSSLVWYTAHPQLFDKIYPKVLKRLENEEAAFLAENEEALALLNASHKKEKEPQTFTPAQLDSILWVTLHGYPSRWNPMPLYLVHNLENQLLP